jgi:hypothetical protein
LDFKKKILMVKDQIKKKYMHTIVFVKYRNASLYVLGNKFNQAFNLCDFWHNVVLCGLYPAEISF